MADNFKKVTIKFELDASGVESGGRKITAVLDTQQEVVEKIARSYGVLERAERARAQFVIAQTKAQEQAFGQLYQKIQALQNNSKLNQPLFEGAAKASVTAFNKSIDATNEKLALTDKRLKEIRFATNLGAVEATASRATPAGTNIPQSSGLAVTTRSKTQLAAEEAVIKYSNARILQIETATANEIIEQQKKISAAKISARRDDRGYTPNAQGTVADNRAAAAKAIADEQVSILNTSLQGKEAQLKASIDRQIATERYGANSIEVLRINAAERTRQLQKQLSDYIIRQQERVASGSISAAGATARIAKAQDQYTAGVLRANTALNAQERAMGTAVRSHDALLIRVSKLIISYNLLRNVWGQFIQSLRNIPAAGITQQANQAPIFAIFGTDEGSKNLKFVSEVARTTGQDIAGLETSYAKFATSAVLAGENQANVNSIFKDFSEVGAVFNLTQDKMESVFLALDQMYGKSTVQSEELKKQLGNVLPGAVEIAAQAWARYTDSADKSISGFLKAMKKGEVATKDFAGEFAKLFREIAGGANDTVFGTIADRLSFQIGRMRNEYTELNRDIFASTQRTMTDIIRITGDALSTIRTHLVGIGQVLETLAGLLTARLGVALVANIGTLVTKLGALAGVISGMSAPVFALAGTITVLYTELAGLSTNYDRARGFTVTFQNQTVSITEYLEATATIVWREFANAVGSVATAINNLLNIDMSNLWDGLVPNSRDLAEFIALGKTIKDTIPAASELFALKSAGAQPKEDINVRYAKNLEEILAKPGVQGTIMDEAMKERLETITEDFRGKSVALVIEAVAVGRLKTGEEVKAALADTLDIAAPKLNIPEESTASAAAAGHAAGSSFSKAYLASLKQISKESQNYAREQERALKLLDIAYGRNEVSLNSYFAKKKQLELDSINAQVSGANASLNLAKQNNDLQRIEEFEAKKHELFIRTQTIQDDLDNQKYEALKQYNEKLLEIKANSLDITGQGEQASLLRINNKYLEDEKLLRANNNVVALDQLRISKNNEIAQARVVDLVRQEQTKRTELQNKEQSIQAQLNAGLITQQNAQDQLLTAKLDLIKVEDALINKLQQQVALNQGNVELANQLRDAKARRDADVSAGAGIGQDIINQGASSEFGQLRGLGQRQTQLDAQISLEKNALQNKMELELATHTEIAAAKQKIDDNYATSSTSLQLQTYGAIASLGANVFEGLASASAKMYGAQSKQAKQAFLMYKAFKVAEIGIQIATNILAAFGSAAVIPFAGIAAGPAFAAVAAAMGAVQLAAVIAQPAPAAHGGLDYVPKEQTYLLDKGERVLSPKQNKDLTSYINNSTINNTQSANTNNIRIINSVDPSIMRDYIGSTEGEEVIMNVVKRNQEAA